MSAGWAPVIKWSGSKRKVAARLAGWLPRGERFLDPFVGGGALLPWVAGERVAGDVLPELIALWKLIQADPASVAEEYTARWRRLQDEGAPAYAAVRERFNAERCPHDLLFLSRTCVNGLIRFNRDGGFNNSLHHTRPGIAPERLAALLDRWSAVLAGVRFAAADYRATLADARRGDVVFLDPPYAHTRGRYHRPGEFNLDLFYAELARLNAVGARWLLTFDGRAGERVYTAGPPRELWRDRRSLATGLSPFDRLAGQGAVAVEETVYANYEVG